MGDIPERGFVAKLHSEQPAVRIKRCPRDLVVQFPRDAKHVQDTFRFLKHGVLPNVGAMNDQEPEFIMAVDQLAGYYQWATMGDEPRHGMMKPGGR